MALHLLLLFVVFAALIEETLIHLHKKLECIVDKTVYGFVPVCL